MHYTYEFKLHCVEEHRKGRYPKTPEGVSKESFQSKVRFWHRLADTCGNDALKHKSCSRQFSADDKFNLVARVMAGEPAMSVAISANLETATLCSWVNKYKRYGYNGLVNKRKGKKQEQVSKSIQETKPLSESERDELIRLRRENKFIKTQIEVIKKEIALREEKEAALLKAKKQQSSKTSVKKDTN